MVIAFLRPALSPWAIPLLPAGCFLLNLMTAAPAAAAVFEVGPGHAYEDLSGIDWPNLQAGDEVRIHWREAPYRSKIGLRSRGTAEQPIRILGVLGPEGQRPVVSGDQATTPTSLAGFFQREYTESLGVIVIHRGPGDEWGYKPGHIQIRGLELRGGHPDYRYTGMDGGTYAYFPGAAGIWAVLVEHLEVSDCEITDNGNGLFVLSKNNDEAETSRNVLVRGNYIHGNGIVGSDQEHNIYTQVAGITFENNRLGPLRPGAGGIALKDRSAGTVIRYNYIESGARTLDLVEPEDSYAVMLAEPGFADSWVYGNLILNQYSPDRPYAVNMFHYGGDIGDETIYRKGTLHFYHNTVYVRTNKPEVWNLTLFDLSTNDETVVLRNNVLHLDGDSDFFIGRDAGIHVFEANNWITAGWQNSVPDNEWHTFAGSVIQNVPPVSGASPLFNGPDAGDFTLDPGSPAFNRAAPLPAEINATHPLERQYAKHLYSCERLPLDGASELGALEGATQVAPWAAAMLATADGASSFELGAMIDLELTLDSGCLAGVAADWWLVREERGSGQFATYDLLAGDFASGFEHATYRGPLFDLPQFPVSVAADRSGDFFYYFGVDIAANDQLNLGPGQVFFDFLPLSVMAAGGEP